MLNYICVFNKGEVNKINDFNQEAKSVFNQYYLYPDGMCIGESTQTRGNHFIVTDFRFPHITSDKSIISLKAPSIFETIKNDKKLITDIRISNNSVYLSNTNPETMESLIGFIEPIGGVITISNIPTLNECEKIMKCDNERIELSEDDIEDLIKNKYKYIEQGRYRTRITKQLIPGLKKKHEVSIFFSNHLTDRRLFYITFVVKRNKETTSYHRYTCVHV